MKRVKIAVIGAGNIGGELASLIAKDSLGDVILVDIPEKENMAKGKTLDILHACSLTDNEVRVNATSDYSLIQDADVCVVTAGIPRTKKMSRFDLLEVNSKVIKSVALQIKQYAPKAFVVVITNPLDLMAYTLWKESGLPATHVVGMASVLDSARLSHFLAEKARCSVSDIHALVLGSHGDLMVPILSACTVNGIPINQFLCSADLQEVVERTRFAGGEIVGLMGTSAYFAAAAGAFAIVKSYIKDQRKVLPCSVLLNGEYGAKDVFQGVPVVIGNEGVERIIDINLSVDEKTQLKKSAAHFQENLKKAKELGL